MSLSAQARTALRNFTLDGVPASGAHEPVKRDIVALFTTIDLLLTQVGLSGSVGVIKGDRAGLNGDLAHAAGTLGLVYADPVAANNDFYLKTSASGSGGWTKLNLTITPALASQIADVLAAYGEMAANLAASAASATAAAGSATAAEVSATGAQAAALAASAYANAAGIARVFDTYAIANAAVAGITPDAYVQVLIDETHSGMSTVYQKSGGVLVYKTSLYGLTQIIAAGDTTHAISADGVYLMRAAMFATLAAAGGSALIGHTFGGSGAINYALSTLINDDGVNVKAFGAVGNDIADDLPAFRAARERARSTGAPLKIPAGTYRWNQQGVDEVWDLGRDVRGARRAIPILGVSVGQSAIHIVNPGTAGWRIEAAVHWFDLMIHNLTVFGQVAGPLLQLGRNDYADYINMLNLKNVSIENSLNDPANEALRMNAIAGGTVDNSRAVAFADGLGNNNGTGCRARQASFIKWSGGSIGNAHRALDWTDGYSTGWESVSTTFENSDIALSHRSSNAGGHDVKQAQLTEITQYGVSSEGMLNDRLLTVSGFNFAASPSSPSAVLLDPVNFVGVTIIDRAGLTTPALPASGVAIFNNTGRRVEVTVWGGTTTSYAINGFSYAVVNANPVTFVLLPADSVSVTRSGGAPTWHWRNISR
ncbi:hypothetical protein Q1W73_16440 [Asticcacaulis sp. ZE23SCel15]|uniref:hypothetical protein n=1 Tax=Asticcacaulis sp. ZE23SCel15 TaxID=3059027 RepID=UPI002660057D|nr:hypothetical protein [Asticcacaulis sp. ZE23SCel15]WKL57232.1 hypothetical protein Q1W73_16440 [Asticcacaulis sp. ZE23SCel15]